MSTAVLMMMIAFITHYEVWYPSLRVYALKYFILDLRLSVVCIHTFYISE